MAESENRAVDVNDGAVENHEPAGRGSDSSNNVGSSNAQRGGVGLSKAHAAQPRGAHSRNIPVGFLEKLRPGGPWLLIAIAPHGKAKPVTILARTAEEVNDFVARHNGIRNLHYHINRTHEGFEGKAKKTDIAAIEYVYADCDPRKGETPVEASERYKAAIKASRFPPPTATVNSGNGVQILWGLDEAIELPAAVPCTDSEGKSIRDKDSKPTCALSEEAAAVVDAAEALGKSILVTLGADTGTQNIDRVVRLPGTRNLPTAKKRNEGRVECEATLLEFNDNVYPFSAFPLPAREDVKKTGTKQGGKPSAPRRANANPLSVDKLRVSARIKAIITTGTDPDNPDRGRSECVFAAVIALIGARHEGKEFKHLFLDPEVPISAHVLDQPNAEAYFEDQIRSAAAQVAKEASQVDKKNSKMIAEMNQTHCVVREAGKTVIFSRRNEDGRRVYDRQSEKDFRLEYANKRHEIEEGGDGKSTKAEVWLKHKDRLEFFGGVIFDPEAKHSGDGVLNLWEGFAVQPAPGEWGLLRDHIFTIVCSGNQLYYDYLMNWMARAVQHPGEQGHVAIVLRGGEGVGKGILGRALVRLFGRHGLQISNPRHIVGNFNSHLREIVILFADEAFFAGDKQHVSNLKALITEPDITIEAKYRDAVTSRNFIHLFMASNDDWVVPAAIGARRFFVLDVSSDRKDDHEYFEKMQVQLDNGGYEATLHDLQTRDINEFNVRAFPETAALQDQKRFSFPPEFKWWDDVLMRGYVWRSQLGLEKVFSKWLNEVTTELLFESYRKYIKDHNERRGLNRVHFGRFMSKLAVRVQITGGIVGEHFPRKGAEATTVDKGRASGYRLGSLSEARAAFDTLADLSTLWPEPDLARCEIEVGEDEPF